MNVSVVIPCFNAASHIARCLESVFGQVHRNVQIICVDDGSSDATVDVIRSMVVPKDMTLTIIEQSNHGAAHARNTGLEQAQAEYIQFLDADDELLPEKLSKQIQLVSENNLPGIIAGSYRVISPQGTIVRDEVQRTGPRDVWMDLMGRGLGITSAMLWKRPSVMAAGGWDASLGSSQEYDLLFRMIASSGTVAYDRTVNTLIHKRPESISHTNLARNWSRSVDLRAKMLAHLQSMGDGRDMQPYEQILFDGIRILYDHDPAAALDRHSKLIPKEFKPTRSATSGIVYIAMHRSLGFRNAQRIRRLIAKRGS